MSSREYVAQRGARKGIAARDRFTTEIREARLALGRSQGDAARLAGIDQSEWSRLEAGQRSSIPWELAGKMAAVVGLDFVVQLYACDVRLRDAPQLALLRRLRAELGPAWRWRYEVRVGDPTDQRAWDAGATHATSGLVIRVDAETRLRDCQSLMRRIEGKRLADGEPRVILVLSATRHNRASVRSAVEILGGQFSLDTRRVMAALRAGFDPGRDSLVLLGLGDARLPSAKADRDREVDSVQERDR